MAKCHTRLVYSHHILHRIRFRQSAKHVSTIYIQQLLHMYGAADIRRRDHTTPTQQSLHWLKVHECINLKVLSLTYNVLQTANPHTFLVCSPFNQLTLPDHLSSSICIYHQSHQTEPSSIGPSATQLPYCGIPCQHICVHRRLSTQHIQISSPDPPSCPAESYLFPNLIPLVKTQCLPSLFLVA